MLANMLHRVLGQASSLCRPRGSRGARLPSRQRGTWRPRLEMLETRLTPSGTMGANLVPTTVGVFDGPAAYGDPAATWKLRDSNTAGAPDIPPLQYGSATSIPVLGDWTGSGTVSVGVVDVVPNPIQALFGQLTSPSSPTGDVLKWNLRNSPPPASDQYFYESWFFLSAKGQLKNGFAPPGLVYGQPGDIPVVGDWDGNGTATIGVFDPATATWMLKNTNNVGAPDYVFQFGMPGDIPVVGDWNGDGITTIGVVRPDPTTGYLTWYLRNSNSAGAPDVAPFAYGAVGNTPVTGDWNGDATTTVGVVDVAPFPPGGDALEWKLRNSNSAGAPDIAPFLYGSAYGLSLPVPGAVGLVQMLQAAGGARAADPAAVPLSEADLNQTVTAALGLLGGDGVSPALLSRLGAAQFTVANLPAGVLGETFAATDHVLIDATAAGHGWSVDPTPTQDEEFAAAADGVLSALPGTAAGREDLLTAVLHEMGHLAGLPDTGAAGRLMGAFLADGTRLTGALDAVFGGLA